MQGYVHKNPRTDATNLRPESIHVVNGIVYLTMPLGYTNLKGKQFIPK